jgi:hypothetical protein
MADFRRARRKAARTGFPFWEIRLILTALRSAYDVERVLEGDFYTHGSARTRVSP